MSIRAMTLEELPETWKTAWFGPAGPQEGHQDQLYVADDALTAPPAYLIVDRQVVADPSTTDSGGGALLPQNFLVLSGGYFVVDPGGRTFTVSSDSLGGPDDAPYSAWVVNVAVQSGGTDFQYVIRAIGSLQARAT